VLIYFTTYLHLLEFYYLLKSKLKKETKIWLPGLEPGTPGLERKGLPK
jgi:hypothetical protein